MSRVAIVSGSGSGIGFAVSRRLKAMGFWVWGLDVCPQIPEPAGGEGRFSTLEVDVARSAAVEAAMARIVAEAGAPAVLANIAGIGTHGPVVSITDAEWRRVLGTHLDGTFYLCRAAIPWMRQAGGGRIINMGSTFGLHGARHMASYAAAKGAIIALTKSLALELAEDHITCNALAPGAILTPMHPQRTAEQVQTRLASVPLKRFGTPEEIASMVEYLVSEAAGYITGQVLQIDGGEYI